MTLSGAFLRSSLSRLALRANHRTHKSRLWKTVSRDEEPETVLDHFCVTNNGPSYRSRAAPFLSTR